MAYLEILADDGTGLAVRAIPLAGEALTVGRDPGCQLVLAHPTVSRVHARVWRDAQGWVVQPMSGAAPLMVHGYPVEQLRLFPGATFTLGAVTLRFAAQAPHQAATLQMDAVDASALGPVTQPRQAAQHAPLSRPEPAARAPMPAEEPATHAPPSRGAPQHHTPLQRGERTSHKGSGASEAERGEGGRGVFAVVVSLSLLALGVVAFEMRGELLAWWAANVGDGSAADAGRGTPPDTPAALGASTSGDDSLRPVEPSADVSGDARAARLPLERAFSVLSRPCARADAPSGDQGAIAGRLGAPPVFSLRLPPPARRDAGATTEEAWVYPTRGDTLLFEGGRFRGGTRSPVRPQVGDAPITPWQVLADTRPECVLLALGPALFVTSAIVLPGWNDDAVAHVFRLARGGTMVVVGEQLAALHVDPREAFEPPPHVPPLYVGVLRPRDGGSLHGAVMALSRERMPRLRFSPRGQGTTDDGVEHVVELARRGRGPFDAADLRVYRVSRDGEESPVACSGPGLQLAARGEVLQIALSLRCDATELGLSGELRNAAWGVRP